MRVHLYFVSSTFRCPAICALRHGHGAVWRPSFAETKDSESWRTYVMVLERCTGLYSFIAIVNINLAVVNILPLPALDGGYLLLLVLEALRGKKLPEGVEATFQVSGFLLLVGFGLLLIVKDTINLLPK